MDAPDPDPGCDSVDRDMPTWTRDMIDVDPAVEAARQRVGRLSRSFTRALDEVAREEDLSVADWEALSVVVRAGGRCTPTALARALGLTSGTVATRLHRLHDAELITVLDDVDGRSRPVAATDEGFARWQRATARRTRSEQDIFDDFDDEDLATLNDLLRRLLRRAESGLGEAARHDRASSTGPADRLAW